MNFKNVFKIGIFTLLSRVLGLIRDILISRYLGATILSDVFFVAFKIPNLFRRLFAEGGIQSAFIPIFTSLYAKDHLRARNFASAILTILSVTLLIFLIILEIFANQLVTIISPGFTKSGNEIFSLAVLLIRITLPYLFFISIATFYGAILNSLNRFTLVAFLPSLLNLSIIFFLSLDFSNHALLASIGVVIGGLTQLIFVIIWVKKCGWLVGFGGLYGVKENVKRFFRKLFPVILGAGVYQINIVIDVFFASLLTFGTISYLFYADRIYQLPLAIIGIAIASVSLPFLSNKKNSIAKHNKVKQQTLLFGLTFSMGAMIGLIIFANEIIRAIYYGGVFSYESVSITAKMLIIYSFSLPFNICTKIILSMFYAKGDTRNPLYSTLFSLILNIILLFFFVVVQHNPFGIAWSSTVSAVFNFIILFFILQKKHRIIFKRYFFIELKKILQSNILLFCFCLMAKYILIKYLIFTSNINILRFSLFVTVISAIILFFYCLKLLKSSVYNDLFSKGLLK